MGMRNVLRLITEAFKKSEQLDLISGDVIKIRPKTDDTGSIQIGDGTFDCDVSVYLGSSTEYAKFDVGSSNLQLTVPVSSNSAIVTTGAVNAATVKTTGALTAASISLTGALTPGASGYSAFKTTNVTANAVTVNATKYGGMMTLANTGATTVTLPTPAAGTNGAWLVVERTANANTIIQCATANKIVSLNTATANTVTASTANQKIGASALCISDATKWHVLGVSGTWTAA